MVDGMAEKEVSPLWPPPLLACVFLMSPLYKWDPRQLTLKPVSNCSGGHWASIPATKSEVYVEYE